MSLVFVGLLVAGLFGGLISGFGVYFSFACRISWLVGLGGLRVWLGGFDLWGCS